MEITGTATEWNVDQTVSVSFFIVDSLDLVGLVTTWDSSNNHSSFSPIYSPCGWLLPCGAYCITLRGNH